MFLSEKDCANKPLNVIDKSTLINLKYEKIGWIHPDDLSDEGKILDL